MQNDQFGTLFSIIEEFLSIPEEENIEIEARFGLIKSKLSFERIVLPSLHPVIFKDLPYELEFEAKISKNDFQSIKKDFKMLLKEDSKMLQKEESNSLEGDIDWLNDTNKDEEIKSKELKFFNENNIKLKHSKENDTVILSKELRKIERNNEVRYEKKTTLKSITIFMPKSQYDVRISIARELPVDFKGKFEARKVRKREKNSFFYKEYVYDFKEVINFDSTQYELEIEVIDLKYKKEEFINLIKLLNGAKKMI